MISAACFSHRSGAGMNADIDIFAVHSISQILHSGVRDRPIACVCAFAG